MNLSIDLKSLIHASGSRPGPTPAPPRVRDMFSKVEQKAVTNGLGLWPWLAILTATTMTMNSPESMIALFQHTTSAKQPSDAVAIAEFMKEVGLRCAGINGIPRSIEMLDAFHKSLTPRIMSLLNTTPSRSLHALNVGSIKTRGQTLWKQIHRPRDAVIERKLAAAHPDLSVYVIDCVYGGLFADPEGATGVSIGRIATSLAAIACLRAQQGVELLLEGHVYGLKKAWEDGSWKSDSRAGTEKGIRWLVSDEGCTWVLETIDDLVEALSGGQGSTFAPTRAKI